MREERREREDGKGSGREMLRVAKVFFDGRVF